MGTERPTAEIANKVIGDASPVPSLDPKCQQPAAAEDIEAEVRAAGHANAQRLAALGGTEPQLKAVPRRRS